MIGKTFAAGLFLAAGAIPIAASNPGQSDSIDEPKRTTSTTASRIIGPIVLGKSTVVEVERHLGRGKVTMNSFPNFQRKWRLAIGQELTVHASGHSANDAVVGSITWRSVECKSLPRVPSRWRNMSFREVRLGTPRAEALNLLGGEPTRSNYPGIPRLSWSYDAGGILGLEVDVSTSRGRVSLLEVTIVADP